MKKTLLLLLGLVLCMAASFYGAWTHTFLWQWFVMPYTGLYAPPVLHLWGFQAFLMSIFSFSLTGRATTVVRTLLRENKVDVDTWELCAKAGYMTLIWSALWFQGWLISWVA